METEPTPQIGLPLPRAVEARREDAAWLRDTILAALPFCEVTGVRHPTRPEQLQTWAVVISVHGRNGRIGPVVTAWAMVGGVPELKTIRAASRRHRPR